MPQLDTDRKRIEKLLAEAMRGYIAADKAKLGLASHEDTEETSHHQWHQWENIDDRFALKASESPYFENLTSAFYAVHSYKYLEDPTFGVAIDKELSAHGIPDHWREQALKYIEEIREEMAGTDEAWSERDAGWNPAIDEITDMTRNADRRDPETSKPFTGGGPAPEK